MLHLVSDHVGNCKHLVLYCIFLGICIFLFRFFSDHPFLPLILQGVVLKVAVVVVAGTFLVGVVTGSFLVILVDCCIDFGIDFDALLNLARC